MVAPATTMRLRAHLVAVAARVPRQVADQISAVVEAIDRDVIIAETMNGWRR